MGEWAHLDHEERDRTRGLDWGGSLAAEPVGQPQSKTDGQEACGEQTEAGEVKTRALPLAWDVETRRKAVGGPCAESPGTWRPALTCPGGDAAHLGSLETCTRRCPTQTNGQMMEHKTRELKAHSG